MEMSMDLTNELYPDKPESLKLLSNSEKGSIKSSRRNRKASFESIHNDLEMSDIACHDLDFDA